MMGAGIPSKVTWVPATMVANTPFAPTTYLVNVAGPIFVP